MTSLGHTPRNEPTGAQGRHQVSSLPDCFLSWPYWLLFPQVLLNFPTSWLTLHSIQLSNWHQSDVCRAVAHGISFIFFWLLIDCLILFDLQEFFVYLSVNSLLIFYNIFFQSDYGVLHGMDVIYIYANYIIFHLITCLDIIFFIYYQHPLSIQKQLEALRQLIPHMQKN